MTPEAEKRMTADQVQASNDQQLLQGLKLFSQSAFNQVIGISTSATASKYDTTGTSLPLLALEMQSLAGIANI